MKRLLFTLLYPSDASKTDRFALAIVAMLIGLLLGSAAHASTDPVADTRQILAGTVTTAASKKLYTSGAKDSTTAFKGALAAYKAVRAAELPPVVVPPVVTPPATVWTPCAVEGGHCMFNGTATVRYGAGDKFFTKTITNMVDCTNAVFGDPAVAVTKACSYTGLVVPVPPVVTPPVAQAPVGPVGEAPFNAAPGVSEIASNFDTSTGLVPSWGSGNLPPSGAPDVVGAFRFICGAGHLLRDDPVVYPGQPGKSHLHQFFGNLGINANSTYASMRASGPSSCEPGNKKAVNASGYWMPAMLDGVGNVVRPDYISIYYKRRPKSDPVCSLTSGSPIAEGDCVPLPNGLRFVFGYDMLTGKAPTGAAFFNCDGPTAVPGHYATITEAAANCPTTPTNGVYNRLGAVISAPVCWDGINLDSSNHRDHVAYPSYGSWGYPRCPATHTKVLPGFTLAAWFTVDANLGTWHVSSDEMVPGAAPGSTFHADWFGAWDNQVEAMWMDNCINNLLNCSGGDMGNGKQIRGMWGEGWTATPRLVPVASVR